LVPGMKLVWDMIKTAGGSQSLDCHVWWYGEATLVVDGKQARGQKSSHARRKSLISNGQARPEQSYSYYPIDNTGLWNVMEVVLVARTQSPSPFDTMFSDSSASYLCAVTVRSDPAGALV